MKILDYFESENRNMKAGMLSMLDVIQITREENRSITLQPSTLISLSHAHKNTYKPGNHHFEKNYTPDYDKPKTELLYRKQGCQACWT